MLDTKATPARRYTVTTAPAYFSDDARRGLNRRALVGHFVRKGDALTAAQAALDAFRVCEASVERELWEAGTDPLFGHDTSCWQFDGTVKEYSRYLKPEERLTPEEDASR